MVHDRRHTLRRFEGCCVSYERDVFHDTTRLYFCSISDRTFSSENTVWRWWHVPVSSVVEVEVNDMAGYL